MNLRVRSWIAGKNNGALLTAALVCAGLLCADVLAYAALVAPASARLAAAEAKASELRRQHAEAVLFKKQSALFAGFKAGMLAGKDMPIMVKELVQTARRLGLSVGSIKYDMPGGGAGAFAPLTFSFPAEGRYADVKKFVYEVETADRLVGIQDLKLDSEKGRVKLDMKLITYIRSR